MSVGKKAEAPSEAMLDDDLWMRGQVLGFPVNFKRVLKHLRQDMRDDWYFDCLGYEDFFKDHGSSKKILLSLLAEWEGVYSGNRSVVRNIPKKGYGERYGLETDFFDRFVYQSICSYLIPYFDKLISHRVLSYRFNPRPAKEKYLFKDKIGAWLTFEGVTITFLRAKKYLLITDVSNFFENISRQQLVDQLTKAVPKIEASGPEKLQIRNAIRTLDHLLQKWTFNGSHGLPQNRDASSFLSNVLLAETDKQMVTKGYDYYRYVDDIRIIADTESEARKALQHLIRELRTVGMNINTAKTAILTPDAEAEAVAKYFPSRDGRTTAINNMWRSKSRRIIAKSIHHIFTMLNDCIEDGDTQSRQFRFAVNRIAIVVESGLFDIPDELATKLLENLKSSLLDHAVTTDRYCRLVHLLDHDGRMLPALEEFLLDEHASIHDWQNYNVWLLLAAKKYGTAALIELADRKLTKDIASGECAAILIWLRCVNQSELIERSLQSFSDALPHQTARYLMLAASALAGDAVQKIHGKVPTVLRGTMERAARHNNADGLPFATREPTELLNLVNEINPYD